PAPVVERAGDLVALDLALGEVTAHVAAVAVEHLQVAVAVGPDDELGAEPLHRVWLSVPERVREAETVPPAREADRRRALVEESGVTHNQSPSVVEEPLRNERASRTVVEEPVRNERASRNIEHVTVFGYVQQRPRTGM